VKTNCRDNISFIIPAFNCEKTLAETVESIYADNFIDGDEIIIINDNSTDKTIDVIIDLSNKHNPNIHYFSHSVNRGGAAARNSAVLKSKNNLIFCLDSDNVLKKSSIYELYHKLKHENADVASFQNLWYFHNDINKIVKIWKFKIGIITLADCLSSWIVPISSGNYLYTKKSWSAVGGYVEGSGALDAWSFGLNQVAKGLKFVVLDNTGYYHRFGQQLK
jgi:glycosyltransferase involved in cell wall biosynthesis